MEVNTIKCPYCGSFNVMRNQDGSYRCNDCGQIFRIQNVGYYGGPARPANIGDKSKVAAGLLSIFFGSFGVEYFYLRDNTMGIIILCITIFGGSVTCGIVGIFTWLWGIIHGIMILMMSDREFDAKYNGKFI